MRSITIYRTLISWFTLTCLVFVFSFVSCKKFIEVDPPVNQIISDEIFKDEGLAVSAVTGIYSEMMSSGGRFSAAETTIYAGLSADELWPTSNSIRIDFATNAIKENAHSLLVSSFW